MRKFLLYYYTDHFEHRRYTYVYGKNIDDAWNKAIALYGEGNLETMVEEKTEEAV